MASDWIFDSVVGFLQSPLWSTPILTFIDQNCVVFDSEEENKLSYTQVHNDFKELVETLLEYHLTEMGVTTEQFLDACDKGQSNPVGKIVFDTVLAAEDFLSFKKMMVRRNIELEAECLRMIAEQGIGAPEAEVADESADVNTSMDSETAEVIAASKALHDQLVAEQAAAHDAELEAAIKASLADAAAQDNQQSQFDAELEHAIAMSLALEEERRRQMEAAAAEASVESAKAERPATPENTLPPINATADGAGKSTPMKDEIARRAQAEIAQRVALEKQKLTAIPTTPGMAPPPPSTASPAAASGGSALPSVEEVMKRKEYLRKQRELLTKMKQLEREGELHAFERESGKSSAPGVASKIKPVSLASESLPPIGDTSSVPMSRASDPEEASRLQLRLALAHKLKVDAIAESGRRSGEANQAELEDLDARMAEVRRRREASMKTAEEESTMRARLAEERKANIDQMHASLRDGGGDGGAEFIYNE